MLSIKKINYSETDLAGELAEFGTRLFESKMSEDFNIEVRERAARWVHHTREPIGKDEAYGRNVILSTPDLEIMIARWRPQRECAPHDHGFSTGRVIALRGDFVERDFSWQPNGDLVPGVLRLVMAPKVLEVDHGQIHSMQCLSNDGVTLHFYRPAIESMRVFDLQERKTYRVTGDCGAWLPQQNQIIDCNEWCNEWHSDRSVR